MSDQNKLALLCILIVVAVAIWSHPNGGQTSNTEEDIFQTTHANQESPFVNNPLSGPSSEEHHKLLAKTAEGDFQNSPFD